MEHVRYQYNRMTLAKRQRQHPSLFQPLWFELADGDPDKKAVSHRHTDIGSVEGLKEHRPRLLKANVRCTFLTFTGIGNRENLDLINHTNAPAKWDGGKPGSDLPYLSKGVHCHLLSIMDTLTEYDAAQAL